MTTTRYTQCSFVAVSSPDPQPSSAHASLFTGVVPPFSASVDFLDDSVKAFSYFKNSLTNYGYVLV